MIQNERQPRRVQLENWEVGGELLDILSRGLYSDAKDALREYVQNGVDAVAEDIVITVDGSRVVIRDDGHGMDEEGIRAARRFGMSSKSPRDMVGYRGIGIYSSFGICEEMTISSRQVGMTNLVGWTFHFGEMRRLLESDKVSDVRQGIGLPDLMYQYSELFTEPYIGNIDDHFTVVEIDGIGEEYTAQLNNVAEVNEYLLKAIPVAFPTEGYGGDVNDWLSEHVGLNPVNITVRISDDAEFDVIPSVAQEVVGAEYDWILAPDRKKLAFVWFALSAEGRQLPVHEDSSMSGFLLKVKGFTLGDRLSLKGLWPAVGGRTLYHHYTGEVHILATDQLYPNAARNDLESSPARQLFMKQAEDFFYPLSRKARLMQAKTRGVRLLDEMAVSIARLDADKDAPNADAFQVYRDSANYREELENVQLEIQRHMRKPRGRPRVELDESQRYSLDAVDRALRTKITQLKKVADDAQRRTQSSIRQPTQPPPQAIFLTNALTATLQMAEQTGDPRFALAAETLKPLVSSRAVSRAIGVLDQLKSTGIDLGSSMESARRELRASIGWSALAPVSLEEALSQQGVSIGGEKGVDALIRAIDRGLVVGLGGRGERYEAALRAIAESVSDEMGA